MHENCIRTGAGVGNKFHLTFIWWYSTMNTLKKVINDWLQETEPLDFEVSTAFKHFQIDSVTYFDAGLLTNIWNTVCIQFNRILPNTLNNSSNRFWWNTAKYILLFSSVFHGRITELSQKKCEAMSSFAFLT